MRITYLPVRRLPLVIALQAALCSPLWAADIGVDAGTTSTVAQSIASGSTGTSTGTVAGNLSVSDDGVAAVTITGNTGSTVIINNTGTIEQTADTGNSRGIYSKSNTNKLIINNAAGAVISAIGDDAVKIGKAGAEFEINNQGTIWQKGTGVDAGQAIDLADGTLAGNKLINGSATNSAALIRADGADAIAPASNMTIVNYGTIISNGKVNTKCRDIVEDACDDADAPSPADAIDADKNTGVVVENHGIISGSRHAITADNEITVTNYAGGQIIGRNGSGVGTDGTGVVINYGLISGRYAGAGNAYDHTLGGTVAGISPSIDDGDGDGVDIDGTATVENHGRIEGLGAGGFDADGHPNGGDGIAAGGGSIKNFAGASIWGQSSGILIDDGANGAAGPDNITPGRGTKDIAGSAATIENQGEITGNKGVAIGLVGNFDDTIINDVTGVITGGAGTMRVDQLGSTTPAAAIQMGAGADILENAGRIEGKNGMAIDMGDDNDTLRLFAGSNIIGTIDGGSGTNLLETSGTQQFNAGQLSNFQNFTVKDGSTTFNYALGTVGNMQIDARGSLRVNGAFGTSGDLTVNGTLQAASGDSFQTTSVGGNYNQGAGGVLETRIGLNGGDKLSVTQTATLSDGATIRPLLTGYVNDGATYTIIDAGALAATTANLQIANTSNFLTYTLQQNGDDLVLVAHRAQSFESMGTAGNAGVLAGLQSVFNAGTQGSINLLNAIESLPNAAAVNQAASQLAPENNASVQSTANAAQGSVFSAFENRVDSARDGGSVASLGTTGLSGGDAAGNRFWVQGLAAFARQNARKGANGYDLDAQGLAFGFETDLNPRDMLGLSAGYTQANNDGKGLGEGDGSDVDSYHVGAYFSRTDANYTLDGSFVVSANRYSSQRAVNIPGFSETLHGSYSGTQVGARVEVGLPFKLGGNWDGRWLVGTRLSRADNDSYTETGGTTAQRVDSVGANSVQSVLGVEFVDRFAPASSATLRARYLHEFANTPGVSATFVNGGPTFSVAGVQPGRNALELGVGYRKMTTSGTVISIGYDMEIRDHYLGHQLSAKAVWSY
ncbi:MAG TPA: autotransporter domain-containing protein [Herbaspirillum sp.]